MKTRFALSALVAGLLACGSAQAAPLTDVVFSNLGNDATLPLDSGNVAQVGSTVSGSSGNKFAVAFTTGTNPDFLKLQAVSLGLGDIEPFSTAVLNLVADNAGLPTGSPLGSASLLVQANGIYTFGLGLIQLTETTTYWVTLEAQDASSPNVFSWLRGNPPGTPSGVNGSGYTFPVDGGMRNENDGGWTANGGAETLSIAVQAVPEPSTYALAAVGLGLAGILRARRRKMAV